jgi:hypothetical protein
MKYKIYTVLLTLSLLSCRSVKEMNHYEETLKFYNDINLDETGKCAKKINNSYWVDRIEKQRIKDWNQFKNSHDTISSYGLLNYEKDHRFIVLELESITIDYGIAMADLERTHNKMLSNFMRCRSKEAKSISLPLFNPELNKAVLEVGGETFIYEKDEAGNWVFKDVGLFIVK